MTVDRNFVIAIGTLSDWLKRLAPVFQSIRNKKQNQASLSELQIFATNCDSFIALSAPVVIGRSYCFGFGF